MADPTAQEQYWLEQLNEDRLAAGVQPLAWSSVLGTTAENHDIWLIQNDVFQHSTDLNGDISRAGWQWRAGKYGWWENHGWGPHSTDDLQAIADRQENGYMSSTPHREAMLAPAVEVVGLDILRGDFGGTDAEVSTMHFGYNERQAYLLGVVYNDLDADGSYDMGEGVGGVEIDITDSFGNLSHVYTMAAGGYNVELGAGTYTVQFGEAASVRVTLGDLNVKLDAVGPGFVANPPPPPPPPPPDDTVYYQTGTGKGSTFTGHANADDVYTGGNGSDTFFWAGGNDTITDWQDAGKNQDILKIDDAIFFNFSDAMAHATQQGADVVLYENADTTMTLKNVTLAQLGADDFAFF